MTPSALPPLSLSTPLLVTPSAAAQAPAGAPAAAAASAARFASLLDGANQPPQRMPAPRGPTPDSSRDSAQGRVTSPMPAPAPALPAQAGADKADSSKAVPVPPEEVEKGDEEREATMPGSAPKPSAHKGPPVRPGGSVKEGAGAGAHRSTANPDALAKHGVQLATKLAADEQVRMDKDAPAAMTPAELAAFVASLPATVPPIAEVTRPLALDKDRTISDRGTLPGAGPDPRPAASTSAVESTRTQSWVAGAQDTLETQSRSIPAVDVNGREGTSVSTTVNAKNSNAAATLGGAAAYDSSGPIGLTGPTGPTGPTTPFAAQLLGAQLAAGERQPTDANTANAGGSIREPDLIFVDSHGPVVAGAAPPATLPPVPVETADKTATAHLTAAPGSAEFAPQLGAQLSSFVLEGVHHAVLELNPADMGPVTVQIRLDGDNAHVHMAAEHQFTREALELAMPQLASSLHESGLTLTGGGVSDQPRPQAQDTPVTARDTRNGGARGEAVPVPAALAPVLRPRGVVDLLA